VIAPSSSLSCLSFVFWAATQLSGDVSTHVKDEEEKEGK
jgi:hypothetical protein